MGKIYNCITGNVIATFENGKVYIGDDITEEIGMYRDNKIYIRKGVRYTHIGKYVDDLFIMEKDITNKYIVVGNVRKNKIYYGSNINNSRGVCTFEGEAVGAACAVLVSNIFKEYIADEKSDKIDENITKTIAE